MNILFDDSVYNGIISDLKYTDNLTDFFVNKTEMHCYHSYLTRSNYLIRRYMRILLSIVKWCTQILTKNNGTNDTWCSLCTSQKVDIYTGKTASEYNLPWLFEWGTKTLNSVMPIDISPYDPSDVEQEALFQGVRRSYLTANYKDIGKLDSKDTVKLNKNMANLITTLLKSYLQAKRNIEYKKKMAVM